MTYSFTDTFNFLKNLTLRRSWNFFKVYLSYQLTRLTNRPLQWGTPVSLSFEPTTACNLKCPECPSGLRQFSRPTGNLKKDFFRSSIDQLSQDLIYLIFYFQGEPYINPGFLEMVKYASDKGLYTITSTNGHFLSAENCKKTIESGLKRIIISVDGVTQESYSAYRKEGKLDVVLEGIKILVRTKKEMKSSFPHIVLQNLVVKPNEHEIPEMQKLALELGVDELKFKSAQVYDYKNGNPLIPDNEKYSRYKRNPDGSYSVKNKFLNHCWKLWHASVITWDGTIVPCCFDKDAKHKMGKLSSNRFENIWKGDNYNNFRKEILQSRSNIDICQNCTEGCKVWV